MKCEPNMPLLDYYEKVFRPLRMNGRSLGGHKQYHVQLRHFNRFLGRPATLDDLDDDTVIALLVKRAEETTPETSNKCRNHILALWRFAARKKHVATFPDVARMKERKRIPRAWSHAEIAKLVEAAYSDEWRRTRQGLLPPGYDLEPHLWWASLIMLLYETGIRVGAARQLRTADVDLETGRVLVPAEVQKQYADQVFTLTEETRELLRQMAHVERELLLPWAWSEGTFYLHWKKLLVAAGLPTGRRCGPHRIRRTTATMAELHLGRGTATGILGHSSAHVTRAYIDTSMLPENRFAERLPRPMLVGRTREDGTVPTAEEMLPPPPPAVVPIEHHVSAVVLPKTSARADEHPLLEESIVALVAEFLQSGCGSLSDYYTRRFRTSWQVLPAALKVSKLRDLHADAVLRWLANQQGAGLLSMAKASRHRWAVRRFLQWLLTEKQVYAFAEDYEKLCFKGGKNRGAA